VTSKTGNGNCKSKQQIPFGDDSKKDKCNYKNEMRSSLHCAVHDETVNRFGRDDDVS
jgi:hypothetical protein